MDVRKMSMMNLMNRYAKLWAISVKTGINPWDGNTILSRLMTDCIREMKNRHLV